MKFKIYDKITKLHNLMISKDKTIDALVTIVLEKPKHTDVDYHFNFLKLENDKYILSVTIAGQEKFSSIESSIPIEPVKFVCEDKIEISTNIDEKGKDYVFRVLYLIDVLLDKSMSNVLTNSYEPKVTGVSLIYFGLNTCNIYRRKLGDYTIDLTHFKDVTKALIMKYYAMNIRVIDTREIKYPDYKLKETNQLMSKTTYTYFYEGNSKMSSSRE